MKKRICLIGMIIGSVMLAAGCGKNSTAATQAGQTTAAAQTGGTTGAAQSGGTGAQAGAAATHPATAPYDYSEKLTDLGYYDNIKAAELVTVPDYSNISINSADIVVTDADVQKEIDNIMQQYTTANQPAPELTDTFVKDTLNAAYGYTSVEDMKTQIKTSLKDNKIRNNVWMNMITQATFQSVPQELTDMLLQHRVDRLTARLDSYGITMDTYLTTNKYKTIDDYRAAHTIACENTVKQYLIMEAIADKEKITVSDADLSAMLSTPDVTSQVIYYGKGYLEQQALLQKVTELLVGNSTVA